MALEIGELLNGRYRIAALLGQGGMGAVYRAWDVNLKMAVAVKENSDAGDEAQRQFEREAMLLAHLSHPHLPRVTDHFTVPGRGQYLVIDYVEGEDLETMLARVGPLPEGQAVHWVAQVCDALAYLHRQDPPVIHRDIKPANIRITRDGQAMLVDFGISKQYDPTGRTTVGARAVTPGYSPPEQYGDASTDARSDTYALGATLYHLLTGSPPPESVVRLVREADLAPPSRANPAISAHLDRAVLVAMALSPEGRFQNAEALKTALLGAASVPQAAVPLMGASVVRRSDAADSRPARRGLWAVTALALLLMATLAGFLLARGGVSNRDGAAGQAEVADTAGGAEVAGTVDSEGTLDTPAPTAFLPTPLPSKTTVAEGADAAGALPVGGVNSGTADASQTPVPTDTPPPTPPPSATPRCPVVEGPFADAWLAFEELLGCATGHAMTHSGAEEAFQFGRMFWRSDAIDYGQALVAFNNGTWRIFEHAPFVEGSPDFKCVDANTPPECPPTPKRGFGMMWCDIGAIRSGLGNAVECERPYTGVQQTFQRGFLLRSDSGTFVFFDDGTWQWD